MPGGRPKKQIDYDLVAKMAQIACCGMANYLKPQNQIICG